MTLKTTLQLSKEKFEAWCVHTATAWNSAILLKSKQKPSDFGSFLCQNQMLSGLAKKQVQTTFGFNKEMSQSLIVFVLISTKWQNFLPWLYNYCTHTTLSFFVGYRRRCKKSPSTTLKQTIWREIWKTPKRGSNEACKIFEYNSKHCICYFFDYFQHCVLVNSFSGAF